VIRRNTAAVLGLLAGVAACAGGGSGSVAPALVTATAAPHAAGQSVVVQFTIALPSRSASANARTPRYVSASTKSATVTVTPAGGSAAAPAVIACTLTTCSGQVSAPVGSDTFGVTLFDQPNGTGHALSTGSMTQTIVLDGANAVRLTFNGIVAGLVLSFAPSTMPYGVAASAQLTAGAVDADGNTIVGPGVFVDAQNRPVTIALASSDTSGNTTLGATSVTQPTMPIAFTATGSLIQSVTVTATAPGFTTQHATIGFVCPPAGSSQSLYDAFAYGSFQGAGYAEYALDATSTTTALDVVDPNDIDAQGIGNGLTVDVDGRVYTSEVRTSGSLGIGVAEFCPNAGGRAALPYRSLAVSELAGWAVDPTRNLYVLSTPGSGNILEEFGPDAGAPAPIVAPVAATPLRTLSGSATELDDVAGGLVASNQTVYAKSGGNEVFGFGTSQSGNVAPSITLASTGGGLLEPVSVAVDAAGDLYVLYDFDNLAAMSPTPTKNGVLGHAAITEYAPGAYSSPTRIISGANTNLDSAVAIALDANGTVYAIGESESASSYVVSFGAAATGNAVPNNSFNVAPGDFTLDAWGFAIDKNGIVYVGDLSGNGIYEYNQAGKKVGQIPVSTNGLGYPGGMAVDSHGNLVVQSKTYCVAQSTGCTQVGVAGVLFFPIGTSSPTPTRVIDDSAYVGGDISAGGDFVALDAAGDVFVCCSASASSLGTVLEYATNAGQADPPIGTFIDPLRSRQSTIASLAIDPIGNVVIADGAENDVYVYAKGTSGNAAVPQHTYNDFSAATLYPMDVALDGAGNLYVTDLYSAGISVFAPGATTPSRTIVGPHTRLNNGLGLAVDASGQIYVTRDDDTMFVFAAGATGDQAPSRVATGFGRIALGPAGTGTSQGSVLRRAQASRASSLPTHGTSSTYAALIARAKVEACAGAMGASRRSGRCKRPQR
jgi:sugar lactone lactonase YvrE